MTSDFETFCDALATDLTGNVTGLTTLAAEVIHKLDPWAPEQLRPDGQRHLAVWPAGERAGPAERAAAEGMELYELTKTYLVLVWEDASLESSRGTTDYPAAQAWMQLHNDIRARFRGVNRGMGGNRLVEYQGVAFGAAAGGLVRWMLITVGALDDFAAY